MTYNDSEGTDQPVQPHFHQDPRFPVMKPLDTVEYNKDQGVSQS